MKWLQEENAPEIRYRTLVELLGRSREDIEVKDAYEKLMASETLAQVMSKFDLNDKWEDINAFILLAEVGLTCHDVEIGEYVERTIKRFNKSMKCARILFLRNLVKLGYINHPWVQQELEKALSNIREDGSVRCLDKGKKRNDSRLSDMSCYRQTTTYLLLAAELKKQGVVEQQFELLIDFFLNHEVIYHIDEPDKVIIKEMTSTFYPIDHVHIGLQLILYGISILGAGQNEACDKAWRMLDGYKNDEGKYILSESFPNPYFNVGTVGEANKWVTLYVLLGRMYMQNKIE